MAEAGERERHSLYSRLQEVLGVDAATTLMSHLPPSGWSDMATQQALESATAMLRSEIAKLRTELQSEIAELRAEIAGLRAEMRAEIAELRAEIAASQTSTLRWMFVTVITSNATMAGVIIAALR